MMFKKNGDVNYSIKSIGIKIIIFALLISLTSFFYSAAQGKLFKIELPRKVEGVEKLEYLVNEQPRGATSGITSLNLYEGSKLNFLLKFSSEKHSQLKCGDVKITSNAGEDLTLKVYAYDVSGNIIMQDVDKDAPIDPNQTYVTSTREISKDEKFEISGVITDKYHVSLKLKNYEEFLTEALEVQYKIENGEKLLGQLDNHGILLNEIPVDSKLYLWIKPAPAYSQSSLTFSTADATLSQDKSNDNCIEVYVSSDLEISIDGLTKNKYRLRYNSSSPDQRVYYKQEGSESEYEELGRYLEVNHGDNYLIIADSYLLSDILYANGLAVIHDNNLNHNEYKLENISEDILLEIGSPSNASYPINFDSLEGIAEVTDVNGQKISSASAKFQDFFSFKLNVNEAYSQNKDKFVVYAESYGVTFPQYDLITPSYDGTYEISVEGFTNIVLENVQKNTYTVTLPEKLTGASYEVVEDENVKKLSENQYSVAHGESLKFSLTAESGYSTLSSRVISDNKNISINKVGSSYTISNFTENTDLLIEGIEPAQYEVTFDAPGFICFDEEGKQLPSTISIGSSSQNFKFRIGLEAGYKLLDSGISFSFSPQNASSEATSSAVVESPSEEGGYYILSGVHENTTLHINGTESTALNVTIQLPEEGDFELRKNTEGNEALPLEFTLEYNSTFKFEVYNKDTENPKNLVAMSLGDAKVERISENPAVFSISSIHEDVKIFISIISDSSNPTDPSVVNIDNYYLAKKFKIVSKDENMLTAKFSNQQSSYIENLFNLIDDVTVEINPKSYHSQIYPKTDEVPVTFELISQNSYYSNPDGNLNIYEDINLSKETNLYNSLKFESGGSNRSLKSFGISPISKNNVNKDPIRCEAIVDNVSGNTSGIGYLYEELYISVEPKPNNSYTLFFPNLEGIKFYTVSKVDELQLAIADPDNSKVYSVTEGEEIAPSSFATSKNEIFNFKYELEEGYEAEGIDISPSGYSSLMQYNVISLEPQNKNTFKIYDVYSDNLQINVNGLKKKEYTIDFSNSIGTEFSLDSKGENKFLDKVVYHGDSLKFYANPKESYVEQVKEFKLEIDGQEYILDVASTEKKDVGGIVQFLAARDNEGKMTYEFSNIKGGFNVFVSREIKKFQVTFPKVEKLKFHDLNNKQIYSEEQTIEVIYGTQASFTIEADEGMDISNILILANGEEIPTINGRYVIENIRENKTIAVQNFIISKNKITFTAYDAVTYKNSSGQEIQDLEIEYGGNLEFSVALKDNFSNSKISVQAESSSQGEIIELPYDSRTNLYTLENIKENYRIYVEGIEINSHLLSFRKSDEIKYYDQYGTTELTSEDDSQKDVIVKNITDGESFGFKILAEEGKDISEIKVWFSSDSSNKSPTSIEKNSNGIYFVENIKENITIYISDVKNVQYNVEIRITEGVQCLDEYGRNFPSSSTVNHGESISFRLSLDGAYNNSTPVVSIKGSLNTLSPDAEGFYILENITENKIIEVTNVVKNTYKVTFKPAEGVIYKTVKGKTFEDYLDVEYGSALQFIVSLMNAYDSSTPRVLLNGIDTVSSSAGVYTIQNVSSNMEISVENVVKNPEELTMEKIISVPKEISSSSDVTAVINATKAYDELSDENKSLITNLHELTTAQEKSEVINHSSEGITVTGIDWYIKLIVISLNDDHEAMEELNSELERKSLLTLYEMKLYNLLTNEEYEVPYGQEVSVSMPCPDLTGYENIVVVHKNSAGGIEYLEVNINSGVAQFNTSSFSRFGIAAKKIPNFSENPSDLTVSVASLVENEDELKSLLGEGVTSQIGELINTDDISSTSSDDLSPSDGDSESENSVNNLFGKIYSWAVNNELLAVILILILGSIIIFLILLLNKKKNEEE